MPQRYNTRTPCDAGPPCTAVPMISITIIIICVIVTITSFIIGITDRVHYCHVDHSGDTDVYHGRLPCLRRRLSGPAASRAGAGAGFGLARAAPESRSQTIRVRNSTCQCICSRILRYVVLAAAVESAAAVAASAGAVAAVGTAAVVLGTAVGAAVGAASAGSAADSAAGVAQRLLLGGRHTSSALIDLCMGSILPGGACELPPPAIPSPRSRAEERHSQGGPPGDPGGSDREKALLSNRHASDFGVAWLLLQRRYYRCLRKQNSFDPSPGDAIQWQRTALQPLIRCPESLPSRGSYPAEEWVFLADTGKSAGPDA